MSHLLEQLEGRERRAECEKHDAEMTGIAWRHPSAAVWINHYPATGVTGEHWQGYYRLPGQTSKRVSERGFASLEAAIATCRQEARAFFAECEAEARQIVRTA